MQISFLRDELLKPLSFVAGVVERRQTLPILSYVLVKQSGNDLTLTGTDLEIEIVAKAQAKNEGVGEMTLPARKLLDICRALPADAVLNIKKEGEKAIIKAGKSRFSLSTLPVSDFPSLDVSNWDLQFSAPQNVVKKALEQTHFCMAQQDVRYYLNGVLFEVRDKALRFVATDGHRMAMSDITLSTAVGAERQAIVPRKGVQEISRLLEAGDATVEFKLSPNHLQAVTPDVTFTSKLIDGRYPDYHKVLPSVKTKKAILERALFKEALGRTAILSNEKFRGVRLSFSGKQLEMTAHNPEQEEATEEITARFEGDALEIGFNVNYLLDAIGAIEVAEVVMALNDANSSCLITAADSSNPQYVVMPMRL